MIENYSIHYYTSCAVQTGKYEINRNGNRKAVMVYQEKCHTDAGDFPTEEWERRVKEAIAKAGEEEILERIKEHCRNNCPWLHNEKEVEHYALSCHADRAYRYWQDFVSGEGNPVFFIG